MIYRTSLLIIVLLSCFSLNAQSSKEQAKLILDAVSNQIKSYENISLSFKYALVNTEENIQQTTKGSLLIRGNKYRINILGMTRIYDGKKLYTISPEDEEVTISKEDLESENTISPADMLRFYESGYDYELDIVQNVMGKPIQYIKLIPIDNKNEINYVLLGIDKKKKHIHNLIEVGANSTKTTLTIESFNTSQILDITQFTFDPTVYKDYYINELD